MQLYIVYIRDKFGDNKYAFIKKNKILPYDKQWQHLHQEIIYNFSIYISNIKQLKKKQKTTIGFIPNFVA